MNPEEIDIRQDLLDTQKKVEDLLMGFSQRHNMVDFDIHLEKSVYKQVTTKLLTISDIQFKILIEGDEGYQSPLENVYL